MLLASGEQSTGPQLANFEDPELFSEFSEFIHDFQMTQLLSNPSESNFHGFGLNQIKN
jgi:hypothetical protein